MDERDKRYEQRFTDQSTALLKAESALDRRLEGLNELRKIVDDTYKNLMPRSEAMALLTAITVKIEDHQKQDLILHGTVDGRLTAMSSRIDLKEGETTGSKDSRSAALAIWAICISAAAVVVQLIFLTVHK